MVRAVPNVGLLSSHGSQALCRRPSLRHLLPPPTLRFAVDPIVRRGSRNSLLISLQQTAVALGGRFADVARCAGVRASAEQVRSIPASLSNESSAFTQVH